MTDRDHLRRFFWHIVFHRVVVETANLVFNARNGCLHVTFLLLLSNSVFTAGTGLAD